MTDDPKQPPQSLFKLNPTRIALLALGALLVLFTLSMLFGGLSNYEELSQAAKSAAPAAAVPASS